MKFTVERDQFLTALKRASGVVASRNTIPILACVRLEASDVGLSLHCSNLDQWAVSKVEAAVAAPGSVCINSDLLNAWVSAAPKGGLVALELANGRAVMTCGRATASFAYFEAADFPTPPTRDAIIEVPGGAAALRNCAPYTSDEETRYYLNGVAISQSHAVATNGHILCAERIDVASEVLAIIPNAGVKLVLAASATARVFVGENTWACEDDQLSIGGKLIDGTFPDWTRVIPSGAEHIAQMDADTLAECIGQSQIASNERLRCIVLDGDGSTLKVTCRGDIMTSEASAPYEGAPFRSGVDSKYALVAAKTFAGRVINVAKADGDQSPMLITSEGLPGVRVAVMGMRA